MSRVWLITFKGERVGAEICSTVNLCSMDSIRCCTFRVCLLKLKCSAKCMQHCERCLLQVFHHETTTENTLAFFNTQKTKADQTQMLHIQPCLFVKLDTWLLIFPFVLHLCMSKAVYHRRHVCFTILVMKEAIIRWDIIVTCTGA